MCAKHMISTAGHLNRTTKFKKIFEIVPDDFLTHTIYRNKAHNLNLPYEECVFWK